MPVLMFESWVLNEISIIDLSSALVGMLMSSSKINFFSNKAHLNSGVRLLLELYRVIVIKHVTFFTICAKLTMTFTFTSLPPNFYTSVSGYACGFGFEQKYLRIWRKKGTDRWICIPLSTPSLIFIANEPADRIHSAGEAGEYSAALKKCCVQKILDRPPESVRCKKLVLDFSQLQGRNYSSHCSF